MFSNPLPLASKSSAVIITKPKYSRENLERKKILRFLRAMEALRMKVFLALSVAMLVMAATSVSAADAPAPSPTSDATTLFIPTAFASLVALAFGLLF